MSTKILIVDDQFGIRTLLNEVLIKEGYTVFKASNGLQALHIVENNMLDLVLLDMKLPGMDGVEVFKRMKKIQEDIRIIFMTAYSETEIIQKSNQLGALTYFSKPFDINEIRRTVKHFLCRTIK